MRQYELTYLISDLVLESELNKVTGKVTGYISNHDGKVLKEEIWGRRKLAYPIKKQDFATYVTVSFEMPALNAKELERDLNLSSKIVRHLMIVKEYEREEITLTKEEVAETEEIVKATGGEKAFEAVLGETEESKDLMAVRGEKDTASAEDGGAGAPASEGMRGEESEEQAKPEVEEVKETKEEKPATKKTTKKATEKKEEEPAEEKKAAAKPKTTKKEPKKVEKKEDEADRLSKLDKELDDILGDDL